MFVIVNLLLLWICSFTAGNLQPMVFHEMSQHRQTAWDADTRNGAALCAIACISASILVCFYLSVG